MSAVLDFKKVNLKLPNPINSKVSRTDYELWRLRLRSYLETCNIRYETILDAIEGQRTRTVTDADLLQVETGPTPLEERPPLKNS